MRFKINFIIFCLSALLFQNCSSQNNKKEEMAAEREKRLVGEYHKQVVISKGQDALFIPKEEVKWYFDMLNFTTIEEAETNDNICFFDTLGNIQYQAIVIDKSKDIIQIKCQNLKTAEYYNTRLDISKIIDLKKDYPYEIKVYKAKNNTEQR